jgi:epoxyqueuosine reductase
VKSKEPSAQGEVYVDTGPVMDKAWAQRAGIGWEGKHTNVITQEYGSWIFLGEVILNIQLEYDVPATDHCGSCTLCLDACPTDAIVEPYVLDSNRCISYLTIEYHGEISSELGSKFNGWIFGCDICQDVCPWNERFSTPTSSAAFAPRKDNIAPSLHSVVEMTQAEFNERFKGSAMKRTKLSGLSRNARVALSATTIEE